MLDGERGEDRAPGVVFVHDARAEQRDEAVGMPLADDALVATDFIGRDVGAGAPSEQAAPPARAARQHPQRSTVCNAAPWPACARPRERPRRSPGRPEPQDGPM